MAILASELKTAMMAQLGVLGTQRYLDVPHFIPAIQGAQRRFNALVGSVFAENKGGEELFREITYTRIFQTNAYGGISLDAQALGHKVWSISAIYAEPSVEPTQDIIPSPEAVSLWREGLTMRRAGRFPVRRITQEQAANTERSRFMPGNEVLASGPRRSYAYYIVGNRSSASWAPGSLEVAVVPESIAGRKLMAVAYLRSVEEITSIGDEIPYPAAAFQILRDLALNELSVRQGAQPLYNVTTQEIRTLLLSQA